MSDPTTTMDAVREVARRALVMGLGREPLPTLPWLSSDDPRRAALGTLAALASRARFDRLRPAGRIRVPTTTHDRTRFLPGPPRQRLVRLFRDRALGERSGIALTVLDRLRTRQIALHPFDYLALQQLIQLDPSAVDAQARRFFARETPEEASGTDEEITNANWTEFSPAERETWLRELRRREPDEARRLLEETIRDDSAAVRRRLLWVMSDNLGPDDIEFLASFETDRAPTVREIAAALLARIEGTPQHEARVSRAQELLELRSAGVIGRKRTVSTLVPKTIPGHGHAAWTRERFGGIDPVLLAEHLRIDPTRLADWTGPSELRQVLFSNALLYGRHELAVRLAKPFARDELFSVAQVNAESLASAPTQGRGTAWHALVPPIARLDLREAGLLLRGLYTTLRVLPSEGLVTPTAFAHPLKRFAQTPPGEAPTHDDLTIETFIALAHTADRTAWLAAVASIPPSHTTQARDLAELLDAIDETAPPATTR